MTLNIGPPSQQKQNEDFWYYQQTLGKKKRKHEESDVGGLFVLALIVSFFGFIILRHIYLVFTSWVASLFWWWPF